MLFSAQKYQIRYIPKMFFEEYINFKKFCYLRHCIVIPVQSFGSHIRTQPSGLGLNHDSCRTNKYEFQMSTEAESRNPE